MVVFCMVVLSAIVFAWLCSHGCVRMVVFCIVVFCMVVLSAIVFGSVVDVVAS